MNRTNSEYRVDLFWRKVDKSRDCWLWTAATNINGYGIFCRAYYGAELAHRISWSLANNCDVPAGMCVCHHCDTLRCVRPDHLFIGSHADNAADKVAKGRHPGSAGVKNGNAKLCPEHVIKIREIYKCYKVTLTELAEEFGVSKSQIWNVVRNKSWNEFPHA